MLIVLFRSRLTPEAGSDYTEMLEQMAWLLHAPSSVASGNAYRHPELPWRFRRTRIPEQSIECFVRSRLDALSNARRKLSPSLYLRKKMFRHAPLNFP